MRNSPLIVAIGGTLAPSSSTKSALSCVLKAAETRGARSILISGAGLNLPLYDFAVTSRTVEATLMLNAIRDADALILGSPGYHGTISGVIKNALDYVEDLREGARPYFSGRAVGCIATAGGWQGAVHTLGVLRDITHALRGWVTPMGIAINTATRQFDDQGDPTDDRTADMCDLMAGELMDFVAMKRSI